MAVIAFIMSLVDSHARVAQSNLISKDSSIYSSANTGNDAGSIQETSVTHRHVVLCDDAAITLDEMDRAIDYSMPRVLLLGLRYRKGIFMVQNYYKVPPFLIRKMPNPRSAKLLD